MAASWKTAIALLAVLVASSAHADGPLCPAGEITLAAGRLRTNPRHGAPPKLASTGGTFVVPAGVAIDPANEPLVFTIEGDRQPIGGVTLPAGSLVAHGAGRRFMYRTGGSKITLQRARGGYRLTARLGDFDLATLDPRHPPHFLKQVLKVGDDCFASVLVCSARDGRIVCAPERTALLTGRVEQSRRTPSLPATGWMEGWIFRPLLEAISLSASRSNQTQAKLPMRVNIFAPCGATPAFRRCRRAIRSRWSSSP
jgi:hypothetical protein